MATVNVGCDKLHELDSDSTDLMTITQALERGGMKVNIRCDSPETLQWLSQLSAANSRSGLSRWRLPFLAGVGLLSSLAMTLYGLSTL